MWQCWYCCVPWRRRRGERDRRGEGASQREGPRAAEGGRSGGGNGRRAAIAAWVAQGLLLAIALGLGAYAASGDDRHPFWLLAVFVPVVAALRLPGAPANGRAVGYAAFTVATVALTHAVFFGEDRYHVVATPALCLLAACALRRSDEPAAVDAGPND